MRQFVQWFLLSAFLISGTLPSLALVEPDRAGGERSLHLILFEDYPFSAKNETLAPPYRLFDLPSADFPQQFSTQYAPFRTLPRFRLPEGVLIPRKTILINIHTLSENELSKKVIFESPFTRLSYQLTTDVLEDQQYALKLQGEYRGFKFRDIAVEGKWDRTKLVTIRKTSRQTLFAAFTPVHAMPLLSARLENEEEFQEPQLMEGPPPSTPEGLPEEGRVLIRGIIDSHGRLDPDRFILLESPHPQLGRQAVRAVLEKWRFQPGTRNGSPVDSLKTIEVRFDPR